MKDIEVEREQKSNMVNLKMLQDDEPLSKMEMEAESLMGLLQEMKKV